MLGFDDMHHGVAVKIESLNCMLICVNVSLPVFNNDYYEKDMLNRFVFIGSTFMQYFDVTN